MKKTEIRTKLDEMGIDYLEKDSVDVLRQKLNQSTQTKMTLSQKEDSVPFLLMDIEDENQIIQEANGSVLKEYIYSFEGSDGKTVIGLSKAGVDQVCRESANRGEVYRVMKTEVTEDPECYKAIVTAGRYSLTFDKSGKPTGEVLLDTAVGSKRQLKVKAKRNGGSYTDPFAFEVCISKAQRNAKKALLPYKLVEELIKKFLGLGQVRVIRTDAKISDAQLKLIHSLAGAKGIKHEDLKAIVKKEFGYESILELEVSQCDRLITVINDKQTPQEAVSSQITANIEGVPELVLTEGRKQGFPDAKILAIWESCIDTYKKPSYAMDGAIARIRKGEGK